MKIIRLQAANVMRLVAVDITPEGNLITIAGKNGAGKSSVLNSIAMALGGATMCPSEPIRAGETDAKIEVDLGDLKVTRRFSRTLTATDASEGSPVWTDTTSTLVVTNRDGARYPSPQAMLDKLLGRLTFDPLKFKDLDPKVQDAELRRLVGLDVSAIETRRKTAFDQRAMLKKSLAIKEAQLAALPYHPDAPAAEVPMAEISDEMLKAESYRKLADEARREVDRAKDLFTIRNDQRNKTSTLLDEAAKRVIELTAELATRVTAYEEATRVVDAMQITYDAALAVVPDVAVLRTRLAEVEATNVKVRANHAHANAKSEVSVMADAVKQTDAAVKQADEDKLAALQAAAFPVPGLGLSDEGVTFNNLPLSQASSSEQLRVSVAIGLSLNPKLRVLLIRNGNMLDEDSMALVAKQAEDAGAQLWCEYVTADAEGCSVFIEDGEVKHG